MRITKLSSSDLESSDQDLQPKLNGPGSSDPDLEIKLIGAGSSGIRSLLLDIGSCPDCIGSQILFRSMSQARKIDTALLFRNQNYFVLFVPVNVWFIARFKFENLNRVDYLRPTKRIFFSLYNLTNKDYYISL